MTIARRTDYHRQRRHGAAAVSNQVVFKAPNNSEVLADLLTIERGFHVSLANEQTANTPNTQTIKEHPDQLLWVEAAVIGNGEVLEARELYAVWSRALWKVERRMLFRASPAHWEMLLVWQSAENPAES